MRAKADAIPRVDVAIVSYSTADVTVECVGHVLESTGCEVSVTVVDNSSTDDSVLRLRERFGGRVRIIVNDRNVGFGAANNQAWLQATGDYLLLLNADCLVHSETIGGCVRLLREMPEVAGVACQLRNPDGSVQPSCRRLPRLRDEFLTAFVPYGLLSRSRRVGRYFMADWDHTGLRPVEQPAGAFLLLRQGAWGSGPPFDERFFMYYEDVDLCRRIARENGTIMFTDSVVAVHLREHSTGRVRAEMVRALTDSRHAYYLKWSGWPAAELATIAGLLHSTLRASAIGAKALLGRRRDWKKAAAHFGGVLHAARLLVRRP